MAVSKEEGGTKQSNNSVQLLKGIVSVTLSDPPCEDGNALFTTVTLKA